MNSHTVGLTAESTFALCYVLTPRVRRLAREAGLVDGPDRVRKLHAQSVAVKTAFLPRVVLLSHGGFLLWLLSAMMITCAVCLNGRRPDRAPARGVCGFLPRTAAQW